MKSKEIPATQRLLVYLMGSLLFVSLLTIQQSLPHSFQEMYDEHRELLAQVSLFGEAPQHCRDIDDYFDRSSLQAATKDLVNFHQRGGNLKSVQRFKDDSIDYTLEKLDLTFEPKEKDMNQGESATQYLQRYYAEHPSPRQGYGEPLPGTWSQPKSEALNNGRNINVMERREGRLKWDAGLGPMGPECKKVIQFGKSGPDAKFMCVPEKNEEKDCHVISVGGNDNWAFEQDIVNKLGCHTYTFDCTLPDGKPKRKPNDDRIHFYNYCIDGRIYEDVHGRKFLTYDKMLEIAGIEQAPDYFKMDVEGYEYDIFTQMVNDGHALLPRQIQVELHWATRMTGIAWMLRMRSSAEIAMLMGMLFNVAGYMPVKVDFDSGCKTCIEVLLFRGGGCQQQDGLIVKSTM